MPTQLVLRFDEAPISCPTQQRYHAIAHCLAGRNSPADIAHQLNISYATVTRWLREFRSKGLPGLFPATQYPREPYTPEKIIVITALTKFSCIANYQRKHADNVHSVWFWRTRLRIASGF
jgi:transposase-like protein